MLAKLLPYLVLCVPSLLGMGVVRLLGVKTWWWYLMASVVAGIAAGVFLASAASAMASGSDPTQAKINGVVVGGVIGLIVWAAAAGIVLLVKSMNR